MKVVDGIDYENGRKTGDIRSSSFIINIRLFCQFRLLYAVGGFDGVRRLSSVERYDPETDTWSEVAPLNRPRSGAGKSLK